MQSDPASKVAGMDGRLDIPAVPWAQVAALSEELGVSTAMAQVLARRGLGDAADARAFLTPPERHDPRLMAGMDDAVALILRHVEAGTAITVHGDYDCDGVTSTTILVGALRELGATVDWFLPSRTEDGYGLRPGTVDRLAARGTQLLVTVDCGITAVDEVAAARAAGMDVVVTDHHQPRADGRLPDAPIVHPGLGGYPCPDLCAAGVAHQLVRALLGAAGRDVALADRDLDLVALATVADCVPLRGENRRLVQDGLAAIAGTRRPGLRALMRVAKLDPGAVDARSLGFSLAPRINAAGRVQRADAGVELLLTEDAQRAEQIAEELDRANGDRKHLEQRILFEAEAQVREAPDDAPAFVLAGDDWHPGVIGIVASRIAEKHHRPTLLIALDGDTGTGSGRSIPAFDLLGALDASAAHLLRHGGHRAAAGCTVERSQVDALRAAFTAHAAAVLRPEDLVPVERVDAVVSGDELGLALCDELGTLEPVGIGNLEPSLLVPVARLTDVRTMGEGKHVRFTVRSGGVRASAVAFGRGSLPPEAADGLDATFTLERNEWNGAVEARLRLRAVLAPVPGPIARLDVDGDPLGQAFAVFAEPVEEPLSPRADPAPFTGTSPDGRMVRDRRGAGVAGTVGALVATGEPVLVVAACATARLTHLRERMGGFTLTDHEELERRPDTLEAFPHVVVLDPPVTRDQDLRLRAGRGGQFTHLAWGEPELGFAQDVLTRTHDLRPPLAKLFRALRDAGPVAGDALGALLLADGRSPRLAGRLLRVLDELELADVDAVDRRVAVRAGAQRTELDRSATYRAGAARLAEGSAWLSRSLPRAA